MAAFEAVYISMLGVLGLLINVVLHKEMYYQGITLRSQVC